MPRCSSSCITIVAFAACATAVWADGFKLEPVPHYAGNFRVMGNVQSVDTKDWPATFKFTVGPACTATAVGPRVLVTAAHCLTGALSGTLKDPSVDPQHPTLVNLNCTKHPAYINKDGDPAMALDIALCLASRPQTAKTEAQIVLPLNRPYERIAVQDAELNAPDLKLIGFGCHQMNGSSGDELWQGSASRTNANVSSHYIAVMGDAWLCEGDSGGAAYFQKGLRRSIVGLNSQVDSDTQISLVVSMGDEQIVAFIRTWVADRKREGESNVGICGFDSPLPGGMCHA